MQNLARFLTHTLSRFSSTTIFLVAALMFAPAFQSVHGQGITGSMTGTVTDPSGAIVAGASVTIRNVATDFIRKVSTSDAGTYTVTQLLPGTYSVKVDKTAYKTFEQKDITVQIDQVAVINAQLQIGFAVNIQKDGARPSALLRLSHVQDVFGIRPERNIAGELHIGVWRFRLQRRIQERSFRNANTAPDGHQFFGNIRRHLRHSESGS